MPITEEPFERVALEDPDGKWEFHCGRLRSKPGGAYAEHVYRGGTVRPAALPGVAIDLDELFRL